MNIDPFKGKIGRGSTPTQRVLFIHVPKCGGSSVVSALRESLDNGHRYEDHEIFGLDAISSRVSADTCNFDMQKLRSSLLAYHLQLSEVRLIYGHFALSQEIVDHYSPYWSFITILRDPKERILSEYYYNRFKPDRDHFGTELDLMEWLHTIEAKYAATKLIHYFCGDLSIAKDVAEACHEPKALEAEIKQSLRNLQKFLVVGTLSHSYEFTCKIREELYREMELPWVNSSPSGCYASFDAQPFPVRKLIERICSSDTLLYNRFTSSMKYS